MPCYSPLGGWVGKGNKLVFKASESIGVKRDVACGQCMGCRVDKSREWAARIIHESTLYDDNCFITLTYDTEHIPYGGTLVKEHFQKFMKRLRKHFKGRRIRYYHCGEYGDKLERPHYHACLFNVSFLDMELYKQEHGHSLFISETLEKLWGKGFCTIAELSFETAGYCARYVTKKISGSQGHQHYTRIVESTGELLTIQPEYSTMSLKPGIGREWYEKYKTDVFPADDCPVPGYGMLQKVPGYYESLLEREDPDEYERVKDKRQRYLKDNLEEFSPQRLEDKFKCAIARRDLFTNRSYENG